MGVFGRLVEQETHRCFSWLQLLGLKPGSPGIPRMEKVKRAFKHTYKDIVGSAKLGVSRGDPMKESCGLLVPKPWESECSPVFLWLQGKLFREKWASVEVASDAGLLLWAVPCAHSHPQRCPKALVFLLGC